MFKYFDEASRTSVMLERPAQSLAYYFLWLTAKGKRGEKKKKEKKIDACELQRVRASASETGYVDFRCMVTDGEPCRNQKIVFISLWFRSGNIRCKWNPYYRMDGLRNKDKHRLKFLLPPPKRHFFFFFLWKWVLQIASPVCVQHIRFLGAGNYREADSKQSSVKR